MEMVYIGLTRSVRLVTLCLLLALVGASQSEDIHTTKVFIMTVGPWLFNWTESKNSLLPNQFSYRPSLLNAPDLPSWMFYTYSERQNRGFIYGAPPPQQTNLQISIIGMNRKNYEVRQRVIKMHVLEKDEPALYEVWLKVDKLNVEDMLDSDRYNRLLDVFRQTLWPNSRNDLYITFLASAVRLGARLPLNPTEGEGIVMHIGSRAPFSETLLDLQKEVSPLRSKGQTNCPDFKHTSVERFFKQHNFSLDWCAFSLSEKQSRVQESPENTFDIDMELLQGWQPVMKQRLPTRNYLSELIIAVIIPLLCYIMLVPLVTFILCYRRDTVKRNYDTPQSLLVQYEAVHRASSTLRSLSSQRDSTPRVSMERTGLRPNPPPYAGIHHTTREEYLDDDEAKTWYC